jgi:hypothetical protein
MGEVILAFYIPIFNSPNIVCFRPPVKNLNEIRSLFSDVEYVGGDTAENSI